MTPDRWGPGHPRLLAVAAEASGDRLLAPIVAAFRARGWAVSGVGGDASIAAGLRPLTTARALTAHGLTESIHVAPAVARAYLGLRALVSDADALLLVDSPELNGRLLHHASRRGVPTAYLAPPQAWAWRPWRAPSLRAARWVGCLLPFEAEWYRSRGVAAHWVGHPLADTPPLPPAARPGIALLPGSRDSAVRALLPIMLAAVRALRRERPELQVHAAVATTVDRLVFSRAVASADLPVQLHDDAGSALAEAQVALTGAGTATLQAALAGRPPVVLARLSPASAAVARRLIRLPHVGLPNLLLGRTVFPERLLEACSAASVRDAASATLDGLDGFSGPLEEVCARAHRPGGMARLTEEVLDVLAGSRTDFRRTQLVARAPGEVSSRAHP